jgi:hypothetical protein
MKCFPLLAALSVFTPIYGEEPVSRPVNPYRAAPPELPEAVIKAGILDEAVTKGGPSQGKVTIQRIAPPILPPVPEPIEVSKQVISPEWRAALRAAAPIELRLFSPTIICYPDGVSFIRWFSPQGDTYEAWTKTPDLNSVYAAGDFTVERRRYLMMPLLLPGNTRAAGPLKLPDPGQFKLPSDVVLVRGDSTDAAALEPLFGLLEMYDRDRDQIVAAAKAQQEAAEAQAAWEKANPTPATPDILIKVWPIQSTQYSTTAVE